MTAWRCGSGCPMKQRINRAGLTPQLPAAPQQPARAPLYSGAHSTALRYLAPSVQSAMSYCKICGCLTSKSLGGRYDEEGTPIFHKSLSEVPSGLRPIRTRSEDTEGAFFTEPGEVPRPQPGDAAYGPPGFWSTLQGVLTDVYAVAIGPEKHAFHMALWLAVFNQVSLTDSDGLHSLEAKKVGNVHNLMLHAGLCLNFHHQLCAQPAGAGWCTESCSFDFLFFRYWLEQSTIMA